MLKIKDIVTNDGRIPGLPRNPRLIKDQRFLKLKKAIEGFPEMLEYREIIVYLYQKKYVVVAGNMRFLACKDLGHTEIPAKIIPEGFPIEKMRELAIKDNLSFGEDDYDLLGNEWSELPLVEWGMELPEADAFAPNLEPVADARKVSAEDIVKTRDDLERHYKDQKQNYVEVICPHCHEEFFLNP